MPGAFGPNSDESALSIESLTVAAVTTVTALLLGQLIGRSSPEVRHSVALAGALRNVGLALLVASTNQAPPVVQVEKSSGADVDIGN